MPKLTELQAKLLGGMLETKQRDPKQKGYFWLVVTLCVLVYCTLWGIVMVLVNIFGGVAV